MSKMKVFLPVALGLFAATILTSCVAVPVPATTSTTVTRETTVTRPAAATTTTTTQSTGGY